MRQTLLFIILCMGSIFAAPDEAMASRVYYTLSIGSNEAPETSERKLEKLSYADDDAVSFYKLFSLTTHKQALLSILDIDSQRVHPVFAEKSLPPTLANIDATLATFDESMRQDKLRGNQPILVVTYSGHGAYDAQGQPFLHLIGEEALTRSVLADQIISRTEAVEVHLIIDACHAGDVTGTRGFFGEEVDAKPAEAPIPRLTASLRERFPGVGLVLATSQGLTHEWSRSRSGIFSHEVRSALHGAADINLDKRIEYSELGAFVSAANLDIPDPSKKPDALFLPPYQNQHAPLLDLSSADAVLTAKRGQGHISIRSRQGEHLVDANLSGGPWYAILHPGEDLRLLYEEQGATLEVGARKQVALEDLDFKPIEDAERSGTSTWHDHLFSTAYSKDFYRGYVADTKFLPVTFPIEQPVLEKTTTSRRCCTGLAVGAFVVSGLALSLGTYAGVQMSRAADTYNATPYQQPAQDAHADYTSARRLLIISAGAVVGFATLGVLSLPGRREEDVRILLSPTGFEFVWGW